MASIARTLLLGLAAGALTATPALGSYLIVRSAGPSKQTYPPGKRIDDGAKIQLMPGDRITLLGLETARELRGPGAFTTAGGQQLVLAMGRRGRFGERRAPADEALLWDIDVRRSDTVCVEPSATPTLFRPDSSQGTTMEIESADGKKKVVTWAAGSERAKWPSQLTSGDEGDYVLRFPATGQSAKVKLAVLPPVRGHLALAEAMIARGCSTQMDRLLTDLRNGTR